VVCYLLDIQLLRAPSLGGIILSQYQSFKKILFGANLPKLVSLRDVSGRKETHVGEPGILMIDEHLDGEEVGGTVVVDEPGDVAVLVGVNAVCLTAVLIDRRDKRIIYIGEVSKGKKLG
jgi:hypothetical protein